MRLVEDIEQEAVQEVHRQGSRDQDVIILRYSVVQTGVTSHLN